MYSHLYNRQKSVKKKPPKKPLLPSIPIGRVHVDHSAIVHKVPIRRRLGLLRRRNDVTEKDDRSRVSVAHEASEVLRLQLPVQRVLFLPVVGHYHVHVRAEDIEGCVDSRCELSGGRWQKVVRRVHDGEFGQQRSAPCVLVRSRAYVGEVTEVFADILRSVSSVRKP
jgi:hypothetical protein